MYPETSWRRDVAVHGLGIRTRVVRAIDERLGTSRSTPGKLTMSRAPMKYARRSSPGPLRHRWPCQPGDRPSSCGPRAGWRPGASRQPAANNCSGLVPLPAEPRARQPDLQAAVVAREAPSRPPVVWVLAVYKTLSMFMMVPLSRLGVVASGSSCTRRTATTLRTRASFDERSRPRRWRWVNSMPRGQGFAQPCRLAAYLGCGIVVREKKKKKKKGGGGWDERDVRRRRRASCRCARNPPLRLRKLNSDPPVRRVLLRRPSPRRVASARDFPRAGPITPWIQRRPQLC